MSRTALAERPAAVWYHNEAPLRLLESLAPKPRRFELFRQQIELPEDSGPYPRVKTKPVGDLDVL